MNFSKGYKSSFYMALVDPVSWGDYGRIDILSGSINRTDSDLRQSANVTVTEYPYESDRLVRIFMDVDQNGTTDRVALFTGLASAPSYSYQDGVPNVNIQCYSVLKPLQDIILRHGWYIDKNSDCLTELQDLLNVSGAPVTLYNYDENKLKKLEEYIVAEDNETNLSMAETLLDAMNWVMWIDGDGTIVLAPNQADLGIKSVITFSKDYDIIQPSFTVNRDWFECPNCLRVTFNEFTAVAKDENDDSPLSIKNRGREIWEVEDNVDLLDNETLAEYAQKRLVKLQERFETVSYDRPYTLSNSQYTAEVNVGNKIQIAYPQLSGDFIVTSQNITLGNAAVVNEEVKRSV